MIADCALYRNGKRVGGNLAFDQAHEASSEEGAFVWLEVVEPDEEELQKVADEFALPELAVEDAFNGHQRAKVETYGDLSFVVLKTADYIDEQERIDIGEINIFITDDYVISVRHGGKPLVDIRKAVEQREDLLSLGTGAILHALTDAVVDNYEAAIQGVSVDIDEIERSVFSGERGTSTERIYRLEREVLSLVGAEAPLSPALQTLFKSEGFAVTDSLSDYFRDVSDHLARVDSRVRTLRELLSSVLSANLTQVSIQQNNDMRTISAWVAIAAVPTMLAGIYGMNFEHMPELKLEYGYPILLAVMFSICLGLYLNFKRNNWL